MHIPIFGNGDIDTPQKAVEYKNRYGVDGVMVGRAAIGYPWIFNEIKRFAKHGELVSPPDILERVDVTRKHLLFSIKWKGDRLGVFEMRRHYANYFRGLPDFKPFRTRLVELENEKDILAVLDEVAETYSSTLVAG